MKMKKMALIPIFLILFTGIAFAQKVSIGVEPSQVVINSPTVVAFKFFNPEGDSNAVYWIVIENDLKEYVSCNWCGSEFTVPKGSTRYNNFITKEIEFTKAGNISSGFYVYAKPENSTGQVVIQPRVKVNVILTKQQTTTTTTTTQASSNQNQASSTTTYTTTTYVSSSSPMTTTTLREEGVVRNESSSPLAKEDVAEFNVGTYLLVGVLAVSSVLVFLYKDHLVSIFSAIVSFAFPLMFLIQSVYAVNVTTDVIPPPPLPTARFVQVFPIGGLLVAILMPLVAYLFVTKVLFAEFKLTLENVVKYIFLFTVLIVFIWGMSYVFMSL
jgi:hypothetical protein